MGNVKEFLRGKPSSLQFFCSLHHLAKISRKSPAPDPTHELTPYKPYTYKFLPESQMYQQAVLP